MALAISPKTAASLFHPRWRAGSTKRRKRRARKRTMTAASLSLSLTHRVRIDAVLCAEIAVRERRDLARLDLAAPAPEHVRVQHRNRSEERRVGKECRSRWSP